MDHQHTLLILHFFSFLWWGFLKIQSAHFMFLRIISELDPLHQSSWFEAYLYFWRGLQRVSRCRGSRREISPRVISYNGCKKQYRSDSTCRNLLFHICIPQPFFSNLHKKDNTFFIDVIELALTPLLIGHFLRHFLLGGSTLHYSNLKQINMMIVNITSFLISIEGESSPPSEIYHICISIQS